MFALIASIVFGMIYWAIEERILAIRCSKQTLAFIKSLCVFALIVELIHISYNTLDVNIIHVAHKTTVLLFYAIGDIVIIFHQPYSLAFFGSGHILIVFNLFLLTMEYTLIIVGFSIIITTVCAWLFKTNNKELDTRTLNIYIGYMFILSLILLAPIIKVGYFGAIFFVISDILIGFNIRQFSKLTFPLYYISLLCFLYLYAY